MSACDTKPWIGVVAAGFVRPGSFLSVSAWICATCGVQQAETDEEPPECPICVDERQYVGWGGQRWLTMAELAADHRNELREEEPGLTGVGTVPGFAIGQRSLVLPTDSGNVMWDAISLIDEATVDAIDAIGGITTICCSHPHFYGSMVEYAETFDARILVPNADRQWVQRPSSRIEYFDDEVELAAGVTLVRIGGHFDGAAVVHWADGAGGRGALLTGDTITVVMDRRWVSFMWSYPNLIPLGAATILDIADKVGRLRFDRIYGGWWGRVVIADGGEAVRRSAERYVARLSGQT
jgi:hypothetical protein